MSIRESALLARNVPFNLFAGVRQRRPATAYAGSTHNTALLARNVPYYLFAGAYLRQRQQAIAGAVHTMGCPQATRRPRGATKARRRGYAGHESCCDSCYDGGPCTGGTGGGK